MKDAGFFKILQPKQYGGHELDPHTFSEVQLRVAQGCMSTAWVLGVVGIHPFQLALYDDKAQQEVWGEDDNTLVSSSYAPMGQVTPVEGGFKFSGHWQWSSGSEHCDWALLGGLIFPPEGGAPEYRTFLIPKSDYEIKDTWYSMGLKATGSQDIHINDVFVPEYRTHKQSDGFNLTNPGYSVNKNDLYKIPWGQLFVRAVSTPAIGATKKMLELFIEGANNKASSDPSKLAGDTHTQSIVAEASAKLDAIETFSKAIENLPEVIESYLMGGANDFLLKIIVKDLNAYHQFSSGTLAALPNVAQIKSTFVLNEIKRSTVIPIY